MHKYINNRETAFIITKYFIHASVIFYPSYIPVFLWITEILMACSGTANTHMDAYMAEWHREGGGKLPSRKEYFRFSTSLHLVTDI